jgi:hypothetical protein
MVRERNFGVAEARIGLSVITCLLVALGYVIIHRLGDSTAPTDIETVRGSRAAQVDMPSGPPGLTDGPTSPSDASNQQTSYRPQWLSPQNDPTRIALPTLGIDESNASPADRLEPSLDPLGSEYRSGQMPTPNSTR